MRLTVARRFEPDRRCLVGVVGREPERDGVSVAVVHGALQDERVSDGTSDSSPLVRMLTSAPASRPTQYVLLRGKWDRTMTAESSAMHTPGTSRIALVCANESVRHSRLAEKM